MIFVSCFICTLGMIIRAKGEEQVATEQKEARSDYTQLDSHDVKEFTVPIQKSPVSRNSSDEFDEQDSLNLERVHRR
jgi:hypothetical protein